MQNKEFYHKEVLNNMSELVFYLDADFNIIWANQAAIKYFDTDPENIKDLKCFKKWNREDTCKGCPIIKAKETKQIEEGIMEKHENRLWKMKAIPELNNEGEIAGFVEIVSDITPVKDLEKEQAKYGEINNATEYISVISEALQQEKLLEMNKFFVDNADLLIFRVSPAGIIEYANQTALDRLKYREEEIIGLSAENLMPEDEFLQRNKFWEKIKRKDSLTYERKFITGTGDSFPVEITSQYFEYDAEEYEFAFVKDISERKKAEKKLKYNQERYQTIFNSAPIGIIIEDENGNIIEVNKNLCEMSGYSKNELENSSIFETFVLPEYKELAKSNIKRIIQGEDLEFDIETPQKNDQIKHYHLKETSIILPDGNKGIISMHIDITERIEQKLEIKRQKDRLNWIIEGTNAGTWEWNIQTGKTVFNEKWAEMIGYRLEELEPTTIGTWQELTHPDDFNSAEEILKQHFEGEEDFYTAEVRMKHKEGHWVWILDQGKVISWTEDGQPLKMFGIHMDISKQKEYEKVIEELNQVAVKFQSFENEEEICQQTVEMAKKILDFNLCSIVLVEDNKFIQAAASDPVKLDSIPIDYGIIGKAFKNNESYLNADIEKDPDAKPININYKSGITIPIKDIGVFQAISTRKKAFSQRDLELAEILISNTKAALERAYYQEQLKYKSFHDSLTNLYNRRFFEEEMERLDTERQLPISFIMADLNGLKIINDSYGHKKGDQILIKTAEIFQDVLREEDILARQGGDEFAILLPKTNSKQVNKIIKRIKNKIKSENEDRDIPVSIALGSATKESSDKNIAEVLREADDRMYQNKLSESRSSKNNIVQGLLNALNAKSSETKEHAMRMTKLAFNFGERLNLSNSELNRLSLLATMHDIGKTTISEKILNKPGELDEEEWEIMKKHSEKGYKIASASEEFALIADDILAHHEHWNSNGYPHNLKGEEIPYLARIISIIDAYDVMTNDRPYSRAVSREEALKEINCCAGSQFDPELAEIFIEMMEG
ncbi:MAG: PAS domain S-box protein, partial [Bacillota bacterium]